MNIGDIVRVNARGSTDRIGTIKYDGVRVKLIRIEKGYSIVEPLPEYIEKLKEKDCSYKHPYLPNWALEDDKNELVLEVE